MNFIDENQEVGEVEIITASYNNEASGKNDSQESLYDKIARWAIYIGVVLVPIFFLPWTSDILELNKQIMLLAVASIGLIVFLLNTVSSGHLRWKGAPLDKGVTALLGASLLATIFSISRFKSLFGIPGSLSNSLISVLALTIIYFLIINLIDDNGKRLRTYLGISLVVTLLYGVLQMFGLFVIRMPFALSRIFTTVGTINTLGIVAAISLPLFIKNNSKGLMKLVNLIGMILGLIIVAIVNWWVLWAVVIAGMAALIAFGSIKRGGFKISKFIIPMTVIVLGVFLLIVGFNFSVVKSNIPTEVSPSYKLSYDVTLGAMKDNFATGYGPENFSIAFDKFGAQQLSNTTLSNVKFIDATSEFMTSVINGGIVMLLAILFLLWCLIRLLIKYFKESADDSEESSGAGLISSLVAITFAFFLYPFNIVLMSLFYILMAMSVLVVYGSHKKVINVDESPVFSLISSLSFIGGLILVLVGVYFGSAVYVADIDYARAINNTDVQKAADLITNSISWNNKDDRYYRAASQVALGLLSDELNQKADPKDTQKNTRIQNYTASAINLAKNATDINPREVSNWDNLGSVYQSLIGLVDGVDTLSEQAFNKAAELRPGDPTYYNKIGSMYLTESDILQQIASSSQSTNATQLKQQASMALTKAETNLKQAIDLSNNYGLAIYNLGVVYDRENKLPEAIQQLEKVAPFNSDQPNLAFELGLLYYRNNQKDKAFDALQRAVVLSPNFSNARWYLALIYEERNDIPSAIDQLNQILSLDQNKDNQTVINELNKLKSGKTSVPPEKITDQKPLQ